jgi:predicted AAA+ superfamily ATPase
MESRTLRFTFDFGLSKLPKNPGLITIRGPRQYGKSTWLEMHLRESARKFGKGSTFYLNGDEISSAESFYERLEEIRQLYPESALVKRLFIDEITSIPNWEKSLKRTLDQGLMRDVLIVTTGSKALDLRRGTERLPGRKGQLEKSEFIFLPVSYRDFLEKTSGKLGSKTPIAYLLAGGSPIALNALFETGHLPDYFIQLIRDWIYGEIVATGRSRLALNNLVQVFFKYGGQPVGFAKLSREAGLANNTVAAGYVEQLSDLLCVLPSWPWDPSSKTLQLRKPSKFNFINLAAAIALHPSSPRSVAEFESLHPEDQSMMIEWLVAQEIWRRSILGNALLPEAIGFWQSKEHEIDFVTPSQDLIEVKRGRAGPLDFGWFCKSFPKDKLTVISSATFKTPQLSGITLEEFLLKPVQ